MEKLLKLERDVGAVTGASGYGKTSKARLLAPASKYRRRLALEAFPEKSEYGGQQIHDGAVLADVLLKAGKTGAFNISYYPKDPSKEFPAICNMVWELGDLMFIVEEADTYFEDFKVPPEFRRLATRGRHRKVSLLMVSQAPYYIPKVIRRECRFLCAFNLAEETDREWAAEFPGGDKHPGGRKHLAQDIGRLEELEYFYFDRKNAPRRESVRAGGA